MPDDTHASTASPAAASAAPVPHAPRSTIVPAASWAHLDTWVSQALRHRRTGLEADRPDDSTLFTVLEHWPIGLSAAPASIRLPGGGLGARLTLRKPLGEGLSHRDVDLPFLAVLAALCVPAGRIYLEPHGLRGEFYYLRFRVPGNRPDGQERRTYLLRVAAGTPPDLKTREPAEHRSLLRQDLGAFRQDPETGETQAPALYSVADARRDCLDRVAELAGKTLCRLPPGVTVETVALMLDHVFGLLGTVPLGREDSPAA